MASTGKKKLFFSYAHAFLVAADGQVTEAKSKGIDGEVAGMMSIIAMQNVAVGAIKVVGRGHVAALKFFLEVPDLKDVRDMFTHFDAYAIGKGALQKLEEVTDASLSGAELGEVEPDTTLTKNDEPAAEESKPLAWGWMTMWNSDETIRILVRRKGEEEATIYEVSIHKALKAVAVLLTAAADFLEHEPSELMKKLTTESAVFEVN